MCSVIIDPSFVDPEPKEQRSLLSRLLSSKDKERRLAALEYLSKEVHQIPNEIHVDMANLLIKETDHRCLVVELEIFVEFYGRLNTCLISYDDLKILWDKLTSFAHKIRGVTVAGKAIPACGVTLKYIMNMSSNETSSTELQAMLSQWRELIETYCEWEQDEELRLGTVKSLQCVGATVLCNAVKYGEDSGLKQSCFVETAIRYRARRDVYPLDVS